MSNPIQSHAFNRRTIQIDGGEDNRNCQNTLSQSASLDTFMDEPSKSRENEGQIPVHVGHTQPPLRRRLDTDETHRVRNVALSSAAMDQPFEPSEGDQDGFVEDCGIEASISDDDGNSVVSSLSNDDSLIMARKMEKLPPIREGSREDKELPPLEVAIPKSATKSEPAELSRLDELIFNLALSNSYSQDSPSKLMTARASPSMRRPSMGRNQSCPVKMDFSMTSSNFSSTTRSDDTIVVNGTVVEGVRNRDGDSWDFMNPNDWKLLGDRKRRVYRRNANGTEISVGSIVGQSTLLTANTSMASYTDSEDASSVRQALKSAVSAEELLLSFSGASDGIACCQVRRPKNVVKEELKYVVGQFTSPIRKIPLFREKKADLKRAKGSLV